MQYFTDQVRFSFVCVFECILPFFRSQFLVVHNNTWAVSLLSNEQNSGNSDSVQCQIVGPCVSEGPSPLHLSPQRNHLQINNFSDLKMSKTCGESNFSERMQHENSNVHHPKILMLDQTRHCYSWILLS